MYLNKDYSFFSKTLHHLALGSNIIPEMLLDIEMAVFKKKLDKDNFKTTYICVWITTFWHNLIDAFTL